MTGSGDHANVGAGEAYQSGTEVETLPVCLGDLVEYGRGLAVTVAGEQRGKDGGIIGFVVNEGGHERVAEGPTGELLQPHEVLIRQAGGVAGAIEVEILSVGNGLLAGCRRCRPSRPGGT